MNLKAFLKMSFGVYLIGTSDDNTINGYISNSVLQVTSKPHQIGISCNKENHSLKMIRDSGKFSVSVLDQEVDPKVIGRFGYKSGDEIPKFEEVSFKRAENDTPVLNEGCIAWFSCKVVKELDVGTHILFIGEVEQAVLEKEDGDPLTYRYYREAKKGMAPKESPTYINPSDINEGKDGEDGIWVCQNCGHEYNPRDGDPENGIEPGTPFEELPDDWVCPSCGAPKQQFEPKGNG